MKLKVIPMNETGELDIKAYTELLNENTRLVSVAHVSNVLGTVNPVKNIEISIKLSNIDRNMGD